MRRTPHLSGSELIPPFPDLVEHIGRYQFLTDLGVGVLDKEDLPLAVWTAAALGLTIGVSLDNPEATADIAVAGALLHRALELDEDFDEGAIHGFLLRYEAQAVGGSRAKAREHFDRALELGPGKPCATWLSWAEGISVAEQNKQEFVELLDQVLAFDVDAHPRRRLLNIIAQRRARWLKGRIEVLFLEG